MRFIPEPVDIADPLTDDERRTALAYLQAGHPLFQGRGLLVDRIDRANPYVPVGFRTDGEHVWSAETIEYVARYGARPDAAFLAHLLAHPAPDGLIISPEQQAEADHLMQAHGRFTD